MSELNASNLRKEHGNEGPDLVGITTLTSQHYMVPPSGTTEERPQNPQKGTLRFNTDIGSLEFYRGDTIGWENIVRTSPDLGGGTGSNTGTGARGCLAGGNAPAFKNEIEFITISTFGDSQTFGTLNTASTGRSGCGSRTRGILQGGNSTPGYINEIDMLTFSSTGSQADFGNMSMTNAYRASLSSQIRGITAGGAIPLTDVIDYVTIATAGLTAQDFGNLSANREKPVAFQSSTRGIFAGGTEPSAVNTIEYITIASTGNAVDFGDARGVLLASVGCSNATRGIIKERGSVASPGYTNQMSYLTIATKGNSVDFGDFINNAGGLAPMASPTRAVFAGGYGTPSFGTQIGSVEIASKGDAKDFGDTCYNADHIGGCSNAHGGL